MSAPKQAAAILGPDGDRLSSSWALVKGTPKPLLTRDESWFPRFIAVQYPLRSFYWRGRRMARVAIRLSMLASTAITGVYYAADTRNVFYVCYKVRLSF